MTDRRFPSELLTVHAKLDEHFFVHQEHVLERRMREAELSLLRYVRLLTLHMRHEEELLLPLYARAEPPRRYPLVLFTGQHQRMRELLAALHERVSALAAQSSVHARDVIALLDSERTYKHLSEHHDGAERQALFPTLDRVLDSAEELRQVERCLSEWLDLERELIA
jgi:hemerythrin-like domain-containing protein